ncbi:MAG: ATP-binding cassette domain-containing protein [Planctomycetota bacterium]
MSRRPESETGPAIRLAGLRKVYTTRGRPPVVAVDGLDLTVERGEIFGLLGPNGAGKTTTVEICEGLLDATSGVVEVLGLEWGRDAERIRAQIGVSLQDTRLFEKQTVAELCALFAGLYEPSRTVAELIALVQLEEKANTRYAHLSGGQRQRLAVATALAGRPELLFLDEPTTGLDPQSRRALWDVIRAYRDEDGGTVVLTTHYMEEAAQLCDRVMVVDHGKAIALGTPAQLIAGLGAAHVVEVRAPGLAARVEEGVLGGIDGILEQHAEGDRLHLSVTEPHVALPGILRAFERASIELDALTTRHTSLEDVFVHLTGRQLRDGGES